MRFSSMINHPNLHSNKFFFQHQQLTRANKCLPTNHFGFTNSNYKNSTITFKSLFYSNVCSSISTTRLGNDVRVQNAKSEFLTSVVIYSWFAINVIYSYLNCKSKVENFRRKNAEEIEKNKIFYDKLNKEIEDMYPKKSNKNK